MSSTPQSFIERVRSAHASLSRAERRLAEFVLDFPGEIASYSATELATLAGVSNATVTRFIRRIGYAGYEEARRTVRAEQGTGSALFLAPPPRHRAQSVEAHVEQARENLRRTFARVSDEYIAAIAEAMLSARRVWIIGFRTSQAFATYLRWQTIQVLENVHVVPGAGETLGEHLVSIGPEDTVIVFALRRRPSVMATLLEQVVRSGAKFLLITDSVCPHDETATWHIRCECMAPVSLDNHVVVMALCHLLATKVIDLAGPAGRSRLRAIELSHEKLQEL